MQVTKLIYNLNSDSEGDEGSDLEFSDQEEDEDGGETLAYDPLSRKCMLT